MAHRCSLRLSQVQDEECVDDIDQSITVTIGDNELKEQIEPMETVSPNDLDDSNTAASDKDGALQMEPRNALCVPTCFVSNKLIAV